MSNKVQQLKLKISTWDKDNYELYDTESNQYIENTIYIRGPGYLYRNNITNECEFNNNFDNLKQIELNEQLKVIMIIDIINGYYVVGSPKQFKNLKMKQDDLWIHLVPERSILLDNPLGGFYQIKEQDDIRLAKKQYKIIKISDQLNSININKSFNPKSTNHYESIGSMIESHFDSEFSETKLLSQDIDAQNRLQCRICFGYSYCNENPLISPCKCNGSLKYIHYLCLKRWLDEKINTKLNLPYFIEIKSKSLKCELCLQIYPQIIGQNNQDYELYNLGNIELSNHVYLEDQEGNIMIVNFHNTSVVSIGRGHESQIKLQEITISRNHSLLMLQLLNDLII